MKKHKKVAILGMPRSGTSLVSGLLKESGYLPSPNNDVKLFGPSEMNPDGYFEDVQFTLLNDQLIRYTYGEEYSFLFPPVQSLEKSLIVQGEFHYDICESTLDIPLDYNDNRIKYTGSEKDYWGISRMVKGEKWHKCYNSFQLDSHIGIKEVIKSYSLSSKIQKPFFLKDPRMSFVIPYYKDMFDSFIWVYRDDIDSHKKSLKNHYGNQYMTNNNVGEFNWSSNHFNHKVGKIDYEELALRYEYSKNILLNSIDKDQLLNVSFESLVKGKSGKSFNDIENFIECDINESFIRN